jgi:Uri superfamily endonuclease
VESVRGIYVLILKLENDKKIKIGSLGELNFKKGFYAYVGSAQNSLEKRIERHLRKDKKLRWHIDYFLNHAKVIDIWIKQQAPKEEECKLAKKLAENFESIARFGCSDCKCISHLFKLTSIQRLKEMLSSTNFTRFQK